MRCDWPEGPYRPNSKEQDFHAFANRLTPRDRGGTYQRPLGSGLGSHKHPTRCRRQLGHQYGGLGGFPTEPYPAGQMDHLDRMAVTLTPLTQQQQQEGAKQMQ